MNDRWDREPADVLARLHRREPQTAARIQVAILAFCAEGRGDVRKLQGARDRYRLRVGGWRVIFRVDHELAEMHILGLMPRKDAYRD